MSKLEAHVDALEALTLTLQDLDLAKTLTLTLTTLTAELLVDATFELGPAIAPRVVDGGLSRDSSAKDQISVLRTKC